MMLKEADLSIGIRSKEILQFSNCCDIIVSNFRQIVDLILVHGTWKQYRIKKILLFSVYANSFIIFYFFLNEILNKYSTNFMQVNYTILALKIFLIDLLIALVFSLDKNLDRYIFRINPAVYSFNYLSRSQKFEFFFYRFIYGIYDSFSTYFIMYFSNKRSFNELGNEIDIHSLRESLFIASYLTISLKVIILKKILFFLFF